MSVLASTEIVAKYYCEFTCLRDAEISFGFLMGRLIHALHLTMVNATPVDQSCPFGLTFPDYRERDGDASLRGTVEYRDTGRVDMDDDFERMPPIGKRVRMFARAESDLDRIEWSRSLVGLDDYVHRTRCRPTPSNLEGFAAFARHQPKASTERLIRRAMKRHGIDEVEARKRYAGYRMDPCRLPWIDMRSESSKHRFRLFVERIDMAESSEWRFSTYGLSRRVGLPIF